MMSSLPASTQSLPANHDCNPDSSSRRLSQTITDIVSGTYPASRGRSGSSPPSPVRLEQDRISVLFEGGGQIIVRPNRTVRGKK